MKILLHVPRMPEVSDHAKKFQRGHWSFLGPGDEEKCYGTCNYKSEGKWNQQVNQMIEFRTEWSSRILRYKCAHDNQDEIVFTSQRFQETLS